MSIKLISPPIRLIDSPKKGVKSVYIADRTKQMLDLLQEKSGMSQDTVFFDALNLYKAELEKIKGEVYEVIQ